MSALGMREYIDMAFYKTWQ